MLSSLSYISFKKRKGSFTLSSRGKLAPLCASSNDYPCVARALKHFQADIRRVTNKEPKLSLDKIPSSKEIVLIGTLGKNPLIDKLVQEKKLNVSGIKGKWETFLIQVVEKPFPKVERALVIAGSDKRGTVFGMFDISEKIGVSPLYWWADVPVQKHPEIFVLPGRYTKGEPAVKYRGIFINDEAPALSGWLFEKFGGFNHKFYEKVFEFILRMRGNYLWPAMWGRAFYVDDPINPKLADEYGIVIGTSHHEPLMRAHDEWRRFGSGAWNYETNKAKLQEFWREGMKRMNAYETVVTVGMRGDGDEPMTEGTAISLLERIIKDQRKIIQEVTGKDPSKTQQVWALYKEVQEYYDKGMRVPDDVMLLMCDDNWGNIRKLPKLGERNRSGGYGMYYHFDYVGGPRNYKWLNTSPISRTWEQMNLAYKYGIRHLWIVNVGDIKPMEFPMQFFLDFAWAPDKIKADDLQGYTRVWVEKQFGPRHAKDIADIISQYTKYNSRRKPELLSPETYSLINYREAEEVVNDYNELVERAQRIYKDMPKEYKDAYYQIVMHPVEACANLNGLYVTVAKNRLYAKQGRAITNELADKAKSLFKKDAEISRYYNKVMAGGKWNHMMDQIHIGYTYWQQPDESTMPKVKKIKVSNGASMGVSVEGSDKWWPDPDDSVGTGEKSKAVLPEFDCYQQQEYYIEIFNRGKKAFNYKIDTSNQWLLITSKKGRLARQRFSGGVEKQKRIFVSVDWKKAPKGKQKANITITGPKDGKVVVRAVINNPVSPKRDSVKGFVEGNGYVSIEAKHYSKKVDSKSIKWKIIPDLGRTLSAISTFPVTAKSRMPKRNSPHLQYRVHLFSKGKVRLKIYVSPTLNFHNTKGLRYAVSFDNEKPKIVNIHKDTTLQAWEKWVSDNIIVADSQHNISKPGEHVLKFWFVDSGIVLQKLVVETGDVKPSYLGPPESFYRK
jgi:hypothetical protein